MTQVTRLIIRPSQDQARNLVLAIIDVARKQPPSHETLTHNWINGSDVRLKKDIKPVPNALQSVLAWRGASWEWRDKSRKQRGLGLIADDVEKAFPDAISRFATEIDGEVVSDVRGIDPGSVAAAYHTEAIKSLFSLVELALVSPEKALESIGSIKSALAADSGE